MLTDYDVLSSSPELFDQQYYLNQFLESYLHESKQNIDIIDHFCSQGWRQGLSPSKLFNVNAYISSHPGLKESGAVNPLRHWLDSGAKFNDLGISQNDFLESTADQVIKKPLCPFIINKNPPRIAVVFHVFYADQLNKCIDALAKIPSPFDIYVSTSLKLRTIIKSALGDLENLGQRLAIT